jgi:mannose-6-phosphate isomerase
MAATESLASKAMLVALHARLAHWLVEDAYPIWACCGIDAKNGGFTESLPQNGVALSLARRARVQPRQAYAFAQAPQFGWHGDSAAIVARGMEYFTAHYQREDGLFRTLAAADGAALDERALLYDQAFALLGFAAAATALDARPEYERRALELRQLIEQRLSAADGAFYSSDVREELRESNPHMHLLEACLAWTQVGNDPGWFVWVRRLVDLGLSRFIRAESGAIGENFTPSWRPAPGAAGRRIEPGHQFEWAWLLLRCEGSSPRPVRSAALRLISIGETRGVCNAVAVNALLDDMTVADGRARLWPQTERLKAALLAAEMTDEPQFWSMAQAAAMSLLPYLATRMPGLWFDMRLPSGEMVDSPAPASSFYHLVSAIAELDATLRRCLIAAPPAP